MEKNTANTPRSPESNADSYQLLRLWFAFTIVMSLIIVIAFYQRNEAGIDTVFLLVVAVSLADVFINGESAISRAIKYSIHLRK